MRGGLGMICSSFVFGFWKGSELRQEEEVNLVYFCFFISDSFFFSKGVL